ncbi:hypothetical protein FG386_001516 [Cryptosporidium ryanae]|uniref:uncharacterized protein n=1 Tax=Cryptosporidium ryanae TaxID=515981 RepID=UPI00351A1630|nr:hypothetical protein FG386_001516 [Cryptosporidium ryanae]
MKDHVRERLMIRLGIGREIAFGNSIYPVVNDEYIKDDSEFDSEFSMKLLDLSQSDSYRLKYLRRLSYLKVWVPSIYRPPKHQTAIIFDWDDTLICTSYLSSIIERVSKEEISKYNTFDDLNASAKGKLEDSILNKNNNSDHHVKSLYISDNIRNILNITQKCVLEILNKALKIGYVFLITNASEDWINYSANVYMPDIVNVLSSLTVISARSKYEQKYPGDYHKWKLNAFLEIHKKLNSETITNLISIGDSIIEMEAVHILGREFSESLVKTVKLKETPTPDELYKQLSLINSNFENICLNARNLRIVLEKKAL